MRILVLKPAFRGKSFFEFLIADFLDKEACGWYFSNGDLEPIYDYWADLLGIKKEVNVPYREIVINNKLDGFSLSTSMGGLESLIFLK